MELKFNEGMRLDVLRESSNRTFMELKLYINLVALRGCLF